MAGDDDNDRWDGVVVIPDGNAGVVAVDGSFAWK